jgi:hypothetical protein
VPLSEKACSYIIDSSENESSGDSDDKSNRARDDNESEKESEDQDDDDLQIVKKVQKTQKAIDWG